MKETTWNIVTDSGYVFFGTYLQEESIVYCFCDHAPLASAGVDRYAALGDMIEAAEILVEEYENTNEIESALSDKILIKDSRIAV